MLIPVTRSIRLGVRLLGLAAVSRAGGGPAVPLQQGLDDGEMFVGLLGEAVEVVAGLVLFPGHVTEGPKEDFQPADLVGQEGVAARVGGQVVQRAVRERALIVIPAVVIAETTRGGARDAPINRVIKTVDEVAVVTEGVAREAGRLLATVSLPHATIDGLVVATAARREPTRAAHPRRRVQ